MTKLLSICIPTYNGGKYFKYNVNKLVDMSLKYNFNICVSDNASIDDTQEYMLSLITKYDFIKYHRNKNNQGWAYNFDYVLKMADTEYAWLLGDDDEIFEETIEKVINILLRYKPDICLLNSENDFKLKSKLYIDKNEVMSDLGNIITCISDYIISKSVIEKIEIKKITDNAFPHTIEILRFLNIRCNVYFLSNIRIKALRKDIRYSSKVIQYFFLDYQKILDNVTGYDEIAKKNFIKKGYSLFNLRFIIRMRMINAINLKYIYSFKRHLNRIPLRLKIILILISCFPKSILKLVVVIYKFMKSDENKRKR